MCRMNTNANESFTILNEVPLQLHMWWNDLGKGNKEIVARILGGLVGLLNVKPKSDVIEALIPFWDPTRNVFRFGGFELTPTLEEVAGYAGLNGNLRGQYLLSPRPVSPHKFLDLLNISRSVQNDDLSGGCCTLQFLYQRYGNPRGFEEPNLGLTHAGNRSKWEARRTLAFITTFLGIVICPQVDKKIETGLVGMVDVAIKRADSTIVPLILSEIYRALTVCREGGHFFQGCNLLLQLWMREHLCHRAGYMNYGLTWLSCIEEFEKRVRGIAFLEGTEAWLIRLRSLTVDQIEWAFGWLPVTEVIYMSAGECHILLIGVRSIQPYAPHRVLRQLGRFQVIPKDENLSKHVIELSPRATFPEDKIRKLWNECRFLEPKTMVRDLAKGEVDPKYNAWFGKRFQIL
ncbi:uncharacterized protein LOC142163178 [Nicotiana tabacum]|uniref:Uncharacterized protein LOC142163178 n=1 Tax=Nicotiana tabacum TaxID=4097 RepID=A0AC58RUZ6_TOBAC